MTNRQKMTEYIAHAFIYIPRINKLSRPNLDPDAAAVVDPIGIWFTRGGKWGVVSFWGAF